MMQRYFKQALVSGLHRPQMRNFSKWNNTTSGFASPVENRFTPVQTFSDNMNPQF